jgi:hypothetical protein
MWTIGERRTRSGTVLLAMALMIPWAMPAVAAPPERFEEVAVDAFPDLENRLAVFVNTTREDLCDWVESGAVGPPPGAVPVSIQIKETGKGAVVVSGRGEVPIEVWRLDEDVPPLIGACQDTDEQAGPLATGTARVGFTDNDADVSLTRTNSFGGRLQATLTDTEGDTWRYTHTYRFHIDRDGEFQVRAESFNLRWTGG